MRFNGLDCDAHEVDTHREVLGALDLGEKHGTATGISSGVGISVSVNSCVGVSGRISIRSVSVSVSLSVGISISVCGSIFIHRLNDLITAIRYSVRLIWYDRSLSDGGRKRHFNGLTRLIED